jgi:hypothetical protein
MVSLGDGLSVASPLRKTNSLEASERESESQRVGGIRNRDDYDDSVTDRDRDGDGDREGVRDGRSSDSDREGSVTGRGVSLSFDPFAAASAPASASAASVSTSATALATDPNNLAVKLDERSYRIWRWFIFLASILCNLPGLWYHISPSLMARRLVYIFTSFSLFCTIANIQLCVDDVFFEVPVYRQKWFLSLIVLVFCNEAVYLREGIGYGVAQLETASNTSLETSSSSSQEEGQEGQAAAGADVDEPFTGIALVAALVAFGFSWVMVYFASLKFQRLCWKRYKHRVWEIQSSFLVLFISFTTMIFYLIFQSLGCGDIGTNELLVESPSLREKVETQCLLTEGSTSIMSYNLVMSVYWRVMINEFASLSLLDFLHFRIPRWVLISAAAAITGFTSALYVFASSQAIEVDADTIDFINQKIEVFKSVGLFSSISWQVAHGVAVYKCPQPTTLPPRSEAEMRAMLAKVESGANWETDKLELFHVL